MKLITLQAIKIVAVLAENTTVENKGKTISLKDVAEITGLSRDYAEQITKLLRSANLVGSVQGRYGGVYLMRESEFCITIYEIYRVFEHFDESPEAQVAKEIITDGLCISLGLFMAKAKIKGDK